MKHFKRRYFCYFLQFHEQYNKLNLIARERTDKDIIYQDDSQIRELQLENRELKTCIDEHKKVIELIMHKYREKTNNKIAETKLDFERLAKLHENAKVKNLRFLRSNYSFQYVLVYRYHQQTRINAQ